MLLRRTQAKKVEEVLPAFFRQYPTIQELSKADAVKVANLIMSLGLHKQRAQMLVEAARNILEKFGGEIPRSRTELEKMLGVGRYISSAIRCYAFNEQVPVVDSNVSRFLSRFYKIRSGRDPSQDKRMWDLAKRILPTQNTQEFNWALIDLGSLICTPKNPRCDQCPTMPFCKTVKVRRVGA